MYTVTMDRISSEKGMKEVALLNVEATPSKCERDLPPSATSSMDEKKDDDFTTEEKLFIQGIQHTENGCSMDTSKNDSASRAIDNTHINSELTNTLLQLTNDQKEAIKANISLTSQTQTSDATSTHFPLKQQRESEVLVQKVESQHHTCIKSINLNINQIGEGKQINRNNNEVFSSTNEVMTTKATLEAPVLAAIEADFDGPVDDWIEWADKGQTRYKEIQRLAVNDPQARQKVTECRENGIPIVLTEHVGWAQFAKRWLIPVDTKLANDIDSKTNQQPNEITSNNGIESSSQNSGGDFLDLSKPHIVDLNTMMQDIGKERVPIIPRKYDEHNPIKHMSTVELFLSSNWINDTRRQEETPNSVWWYLHQWQFPLSSNKDVVSMLCGRGKNNPLPNDILGDDLLRYWLDEGRCNSDSPYQYLFMGREGTRSKLHRDGGGLMITIAPLVGSKEVTLVHRNCGATSLYNLDANIERINLDKYPMLYNIRAWKTIIKPGEILLMPEGTYHACRNVTPCFSYHRFYLDTLNLPSFLESYFSKEAKEIQHDEVIWNAAHALMGRVDGHLEFIQCCEAFSKTPAPQKVQTAIHDLRILRNISRAILVKLEDKVRVKGQTATIVKDHKSWFGIVHDIDELLHNFRHRYNKNPPKFLWQANSDFYTVYCMGMKVQSKEGGKRISKKRRRDDV